MWVTSGKQIEAIRGDFQENSLKVLFQLSLSQRNEKGNGSCLAPQATLTPECMMPWTVVPKRWNECGSLMTVEQPHQPWDAFPPFLQQGELNFSPPFFLFCGARRLGGISVPRPGIKPCPRQWKHRVITTGPTGNFFFLFAFALTDTKFHEDRVSQSYSSHTWLLFGSGWCF